jgi:hypothetical protein
VTRYKWIAAWNAEGFPIKLECKIAEVSRQVFNDWRAKQAAPPTDADVADTELVIESLHVVGLVRSTT